MKTRTSVNGLEARPRFKGLIRWPSVCLALGAALAVLLLNLTALGSPGWTTPVAVSTTSTTNYQQQVALDSSGYPHVVWSGYDGSILKVYYSANTVSGWTSPVIVSTGSTTENWTPQIALDAGGAPHVVWQAWSGSDYQIYYSEDSGSGWSTPALISSNTSNNWDPEMALDTDGNTYITWQGQGTTDYSTCFSSNAGGSWSTPFIVSGALTDNLQQQIAVGPDSDPHIVWSGKDGGTESIYHSVNSEGAAWSVPIAVSGSSTGNGSPQVSVDAGGNAHVVWVGSDGSTDRVYYSSESAGVFSTPLIVSNTSTANQYPSLCVDPSANPHVSWEGNDGSTDRIFYSERFRDLWTSPTDVSDTSTDNSSQDLALDSQGNPYIVWSGVSGTANNIYFAENVGGGFSTPLVVSTGSSTANFTPQFALDAGADSHVTWYGNDGTTDQVYYSADIAMPTVTTTAPGGITSTGAISGGNVTFSGGDPVTARGVCWSTSPNPTTVGSHTTDGAGTGVFTSNMTGLSNGTLYHVRAYATNTAGTAYGSDIPFTTVNPVPVVSSISPSSGPPGTQVTISGGNFGTVQGSSTVTVGGVQARVVSWSGAEIVIVIPAGAKSGAVAVTTASGGRSNTDKDFTVTASPTWYLAEGSNAWGFNTYISIENPNEDAVHARLTYMDPNLSAAGEATAGTRTIALAPMSQTTVSSTPDIGAVNFSTKVECLEGKTIAVDRTMHWVGTGYPEARCGYHSSIGATSPAKTWYLPEGSSAWGFETWTLVENPNPTQASVTLTYMTEAGPVSVSRTVPAHSRATYSMQADIGAVDSSIQVSSDVPVVAERSMYRDNRREGSCSIGATAPSTDFFLAEGAIGWDVGFTTYVLVQNPQDAANDVTLTYQTASGEVAGPSFTMPPRTRRTVMLNDQLPPGTNVSTTVHGSKPLVAERAMYFDNGTGQAFHASVGLDSPHMVFMLPDGQTSGGFETWTLVQNPNPGAVKVRITYLPQNGGAPVTFTDEIPAGTRSTYNMSSKITSGRASILVQSLDGGRPVMVERAMYANSRGAGTDTIGGFSDPVEIDNGEPSVASVQPASGPAFSSVVLTGKGFSNASKVTFGTKASPVFTVTSPTTITALVPDRAVTGRVTVTTPGGTSRPSVTFSVLSNFDPTADFQARDSLPQSPMPQSEWYAGGKSSWGPPASTYAAVSAPSGIDPVVWKRARVIAVGMKYLGLSYQHHHIPTWNPPASLVGSGKQGTGLDCSNFTSWVFNYGLGDKFSSDITAQANGPGRVLGPSEQFQPGDLLFIRNRARTKVTHVVIYVDPGHIMDCHNTGVAVRPFQGWYKDCLDHARRIIDGD